MKLTFKNGDTEISCNCELMASTENPIIWGFHVTTVEKTIVTKYKNEIENAKNVLVFEENDGVEFTMLTATVIDKHKDFSIIRINCLPKGEK